MTYNVNIKSLIALGHILNDFTNFENNLNKVLNKAKPDFLDNLKIISLKSKFLINHKAKKFYDQNKSVIDNINNYIDIDEFIKINYLKESNLTYFYEYFVKNYDNLNQIMQVLYTLDDLGFNELSLNEEEDFTNEIYSLDPNTKNNFNFVYVDNIKVLPSSSDKINYITTSSNYKIILDRLNKNICKFHRIVIVNTLLFDYHTLPHHLTKEDTFDKICLLKEQNKDLDLKVKDIVSLENTINDLINNISLISSITSNLSFTNEKITEIKQILLTLEKELLTIKKLKDNYTEDICQSYPKIDRRVLEQKI